MTKIINLISGLIGGLVFGLGMYFISVNILCLRWPPPANIFHIHLSNAMLQFRWVETIKFGSTIGIAIGLINGIIFADPYATLSKTGIQCWVIIVITIFIRHWSEMSGAWLTRLILLTPLSLFLSFLFFTIVVSFCESLFKRYQRV